MMLGKLLLSGTSKPLIWIIVGQGPTALAVGEERVVWTFFSCLLFLLSISFWPDID